MSDIAAAVATRRALLVVNQQARGGKGSLAPALAVLEEAGIVVEVAAFDAEQTVADVIRARRDEGFDCIIVGGGDGTLNAAAPALVESGLPFGVLPMGTANDLARTLGIVPDIAAAAAVIAAGALRAIDLGVVNGHLFFNVASIGFSAALTKILTKDWKRKWGKLAYAMAAFSLMTRMRPFTAFITQDGETAKVKTMQVSVGKGRHYGGGLTVDAAAEPDDGTLYLYSLEIRHWWQLMILVPYLRRGTHGNWRDVRAFRTDSCSVRTRRPRPINADGELIGRTPAEFSPLSKALRVYAPAGSATAAQKR